MMNLILGGDAMLGRGVNQVIHREGPEYPLGAIAPITSSADLFFANLECAISPDERLFSGAPKVFYYRADPPAADTLKEAGVDLVSLANNHALDADYQGLLDTLQILERKGIGWVGAGQDVDAASQPAVVEKDGVRIGAQSYCDHQEDFAAGEGRFGIRYVDLQQAETVDRITREVAALARECEHVVVAFHWMPNWVREIPYFYRDLGRKLIEAGASIVWGHSPHHILGVEWIDGGLILYSTGGLVDDYAVDANFRNDRSLLFRVEMDGGRIDRVEGLPIELDFAHTEPATGKVWDWIANRFETLCSQVGSRVITRGDWLEVQPG